jgi:hypothetical protein
MGSWKDYDDDNDININNNNNNINNNNVFHFFKRKDMSDVIYVLSRTYSTFICFAYDILHIKPSYFMPVEGTVSSVKIS